MILDKIIPIYSQLRQEEYTYCIFPFQYNKVEFDVFFDIGQSPFRIGFLQLQGNFQLWVNVMAGFRISTQLDLTDYKRLCEILKLRKGDDKFLTSVFFKTFNDKIPSNVPEIDRGRQIKLVVNVFKVEHSDKIYYDGQYDWDRLKIDKKRSLKNLDKTRLFLPKLYPSIKDRNISVRYSTIDTDQDAKYF